MGVGSWRSMHAWAGVNLSNINPCAWGRGQTKLGEILPIVRKGTETVLFRERFNGFVPHLSLVKTHSCLSYVQYV